MTDRSAIIEKAARAWGDEAEKWAVTIRCPDDAVVSLVDEPIPASPDGWAYSGDEDGANAFVARKCAEAALLAVAPGLPDGSAWLAPWEATEAMDQAGGTGPTLTDGWRGGRRAWAAMRDAYLGMKTI